MAIQFGTLVGPFEMLSRLARMRRATLCTVIPVVAILMASSAFAHHSHAMFDTDKQVTLVGTVKQFEWNNPHCWIQLLVPDPNDPNAAPVEWGVEMGAPIQLIRHGWKPSSVKLGDKITVVVNPLRDGRPAGQIVSATGVDGKPIGAVPETNGK
jgi:Family of unknown function (DUF6152)